MIRPAASIIAVAALLLAGCATAAPVSAPVPAASCDGRMIDHNRRACQERQLDFQPPSEAAPCGRCVP